MVLHPFVSPSGALSILGDRHSLFGTNELDGGSHMQKRRTRGCQEAGKVWGNEEEKGLKSKQEGKVKRRWRKLGLEQKGINP